jgi:hypothetical protein
MAQFFDIPEDNFFQYVKDYWKEEQSRKMNSTFVNIKNSHNKSGYDSDHSDDSSSTISTSSSLEE